MFEEEIQIKGRTFEKSMGSGAVHHGIAPGGSFHELPVAVVEMIHVDKDSPLGSKAASQHRLHGGIPLTILHGTPYGA